jgi:hypothetical protein
MSAQTAKIIDSMPISVSCRRDDLHMMTIHTRSRTDALRLAEVWRGGYNMAQMAELMLSMGLKP